MRIHTVAAVWAFPVICLVIVLLDLADGNIFYGDVDDRLRALHATGLLELSIDADGMRAESVIAKASGMLGWSTLSVTETGEGTR